MVGFRLKKYSLDVVHESIGHSFSKYESHNEVVVNTIRSYLDSI